MIELMIVVAIISVLAAISIPGLMSARMDANEAVAIANLRSYISCQGMFRQKDWDGDGKKHYAVPFGLLYSAEANGRSIALIDKDFARATSPDKARTGYFYTDITVGSEGPLESLSTFALCASPAFYGGSGRKTFITDNGGFIYSQDLGDNIPVGAWPADVEDEGWTSLQG